MAKRGNITDDFMAVRVVAGTTTVHSRHAWGYAGTTSTAPSASVSASGTPGRLSITADGGTNAQLSLGAANTVRFGDVASIRIRAEMSSTSDIIFRLGLGNATDFASAEAVYLQYASSVGSEWRTVERDAGTPTTTATTVVATTAQTTWELVRVSASLWHVFVVTSSGRTFVSALSSANLPDDGDTATIRFYLEATTGTAKTARIDLVEYTTVEYDNR